MLKKIVVLSFPILLLYFLIIWVSNVHTTALNEDEPIDHHQGPLVKKDERRSLVSTEYGEISAVDISDGQRGSYHLQFITLEPNSLFLPVLLHAEMVFYVHTGSGRLSWADEEKEIKRMNLRRGDVYRLKPGSVLFLQSDLLPERKKLRIYAIFANSADDLHQPSIGVYSSIHDMVIGFDQRVLQAAFMVSEELIEALTNGTKQAAIVHGVPEKARTFWEWEVQLIKGILGSKGYNIFDVNKKKEKTTTFNILSAHPDFENCNGWSLTVTKKDLHALKGSKFGLFMVNLTKGSMMGPHWNPMATEITIVLQGQGIIRVVCPSTAKESECKNMRFRVEEGDVFAVPRFHPMAQMAFNNDSLVFMGFSTTTKKNHPQFLAGKASVFHTLDKQVLAASFNVTNTTIDQLLSPGGESIILDCTSCAEEEERIMEEEIEKERQEARGRDEEEARKREEEEARKREEEEARKREEKKRREEEEEARKREEEEARKREEEETRKEEEKRREEEEEARKREEEEARKREEEEARKREEEEARKREEEDARKKEEEERREEEKAARKREEEEEREREEEEGRRKEEEEARRREEEEERQREEEEARRREEEARKREEQRQQEEVQRREEEEEEESRREEEEARRQEEERYRQEEKEARREEEEGQEREREQENEAGGSERQRKEEREFGNGSNGEGRVWKKIWKV